MNIVALTGRLTRDPELKTLPSGIAVCQLRLAVDRMGRKDSTGYVDVASFGAAGEAAARTLGKGWLVAVSGRLAYEEWETNGSTRSAIRVVGHVEFLRAPANGNGNGASAEEAVDAGDVTPSMAGDAEIAF